MWNSLPDTGCFSFLASFFVSSLKMLIISVYLRCDQLMTIALFVCLRIFNAVQLLALVPCCPPVMIYVLQCTPFINKKDNYLRHVPGLNDDRWHNVSVTVDLLTARLTVDVTSDATSTEHRAMSLMTSAIASSAHDDSWNPVTSFISLGGVTSSTVDQFSPTCLLYTSDAADE